MQNGYLGSILLPALCFLGACAADEAPPAVERQGEPVEVRVATVEAADQSSLYDAIGTVRAEHSALISSRIPSYIRQVHVDAADRVRQGQLLIELDDRDLLLRLDQATAAKTEVDEAIQEAMHALASAQSQLELAELTHKRFEDLLARKSVSQHEYDEVAARLRAASAGVEMAQARKRQADAKRTQVEAQIAAAEVSAGYSKIYAPFEGVVTERRMDAGTLAAPGAPILVIDQAGRFRLEASVPESRLNIVRTGDIVPVRLDGLENPVEGRITEVVPAVDPGSRTAIVRISLPSLSNLRSGMFGRASLIAGGSKSALTVPEGAVVRRGQLQSVFVVENDVARRRLVSLGSGASGRQTVLSGLSGGEQVVLNPQDVRDGAPVRVSGAGGGSQS
ncbi:MAG: efflux RND transporter periplasmic adaptor subunit [Bryobacterales bacterium]